MKYLPLLLTLSFLMGCSDDPLSTNALSPEMTTARNKALTLCSGCHGPSGIGTSDLIPNLAGQKKAYMVKQLMDFQRGARGNHPPMRHIAGILTEKQIELISEYYSTR